MRVNSIETRAPYLIIILRNLHVFNEYGIINSPPDSRGERGKGGAGERGSGRKGEREKGGAGERESGRKGEREKGRGMKGYHCTYIMILIQTVSVLSDFRMGVPCGDFALSEGENLPFLRLI